MIGTETDWEERQEAALRWLLLTFHRTQQQGSAAYYRKPPWRSGEWFPAYPETTGYIIPTLINYFHQSGNEQLTVCALRAADWIASLQLPGGALPGGIGLTGKPSIFNTGQMLFGLMSAWQLAGRKKYLEVAGKAVRWLLDELEPDGSWKVAAYRPGFVPSYYTRVIWSVLNANRALQWEEVNDRMRHALDFYLQRITPWQSVRYWAFDYGERATTHTIAYTLRGMLEAGLLLGDKRIVDAAGDIAEKIRSLLQIHGRLAGAYDERWNGTYYYQCLTGNAQLSIVFSRLNEIGWKEAWVPAARKALEPVLQSQYFGKDPERYGAIPGSRPYWGPYFRFAYPNWATKFFLDSLLYLENKG